MSESIKLATSLTPGWKSCGFAPFGTIDFTVTYSFPIFSTQFLTIKLVVPILIKFESDESFFEFVLVHPKIKQIKNNIYKNFILFISYPY